MLLTQDMAGSRLSFHWLSKLQTIPRRWLIIGGVVAAVLLIAYAVAFMIDEPLRRYTEAKMNRALKGYTAHVGALRFHPLGFSLHLFDVVVTQNAHPDPPVISIPALKARVHWRALFHARLVGDILIARPVVHVNLAQAATEIRDPTPLKERGWQEALEAIYPLKINHFRVKDADVTYVDHGPFKPLRIQHLDIDATNIRNIKSGEGAYPSPFHLDAVVFESGRVAARGRADFLAVPNPAFRANYTLENIGLDYFKPLTNRYNVVVDKGTLSAEGLIESTSERKTVEVTRASLTDLHVDYVHTAPTARTEQVQRAQAAQAIKSTSNAPELLYRVAQLRIHRGNLGFVNRQTSPPYRLFLGNTEAVIANLTNHKSQGPAKAHVTAKFMGTGSAVVDATVRAESAGPAFDASVKIDDVEMTSMNDLLRAFGRFDVVAGTFYFYSELKVHDGAINGYVKPLFKDLVAYDPQQDRNKSALKKLYERTVGGVARVLQNRPRAEVATRADVSGHLENPKVSTFEVVVKLIQNAFFKAILPGFDHETSRSRYAAARN